MTGMWKLWKHMTLKFSRVLIISMAALFISLNLSCMSQQEQQPSQEQGEKLEEQQSTQEQEQQSQSEQQPQGEQSSGLLTEILSDKEDSFAETETETEKEVKTETNAETAAGKESKLLDPSEAASPEIRRITGRIVNLNDGSTAVETDWTSRSKATHIIAGDFAEALKPRAGYIAALSCITLKRHSPWSSTIVVVSVESIESIESFK